MAAILSRALFVVALALAACGSPRTAHPGSGDARFMNEAPPLMRVDPPDVHIVGDHLTIDSHIHFALDSDAILESSDAILDNIAQMIRRHPNEIPSLRVIGHTDESGDSAHNQDLSERRAAAVMRALRARAVEIPLEPSGAGETQPACQQDNDECRAENRRVEFVIGTAGGAGG